MTYIPATQAGGLPTFLDNFDEAALGDNWTIYQTWAPYKTIVLSGGKAVLDAQAGQDISDYTPRITMPIPYFPCEIETKLHSWNNGPRTLAGILIGSDGQAAGASAGLCLFSEFNDATDKCIRVEGNSQVLAGPTIQNTVPVWFKIICLGSYLGARWKFLYSTDGTNWTAFYTRTLSSALGGLCTGLWIGNWYNQPAVNAQFEYFKVSPYLPDGPG